MGCCFGKESQRVEILYSFVYSDIGDLDDANLRWF